MVNTFLPYPNFKESAAVLDWKRLGKQRAEAKQILGVLRGEYTAWVNTPMVRMWRGYEGLLCVYGIRVCEEWIRRGYNDNTLPYFKDMVRQYDTCEEPWWAGNNAYHTSHQSNLIRKLPQHYRPIFGPGVPNNLPYFWPVTFEDLNENLDPNLAV